MSMASRSSDSLPASCRLLPPMKVLVTAAETTVVEVFKNRRREEWRVRSDFLGLHIGRSPFVPEIHLAEIFLRPCQWVQGRTEPSTTTDIKCFSQAGQAFSGCSAGGRNDDPENGDKRCKQGAARQLSGGSLFLSALHGSGYTSSEKLQTQTPRLQCDSDTIGSRFFPGRITQDFRNVTIAASPAGRLLTHLANEWLRSIRGQGTIKPCVVWQRGFVAWAGLFSAGSFVAAVRTAAFTGTSVASWLKLTILETRGA